MISEILSAIAWPIVALVLIAVVARGGMNAPLASLADSIRGLFSGITQAKNDLVEVERKLSDVANALEPSLRKFTSNAEQIKHSVDDAITQLSDKMTALEDRFEKLNRVFVESQIDQAQDDRGLAMLTAPAEEVARIDPAEATRSFAEIQERWGRVKGVIFRKWPNLEVADNRSLRDALDGQGISVDGEINMSDVRDQIASLHKRFRTYSRMRSTIETWLTPELAASYLADADALLAKLGR